MGPAGAPDPFGVVEKDVSGYTSVHNDEDGIAAVRPTCDLLANKGFINKTYALVQRQSLEPVGAPYSPAPESTDEVWRTEIGWSVDRPGRTNGRGEPGTLPG